MPPVQLQSLPAEAKHTIKDGEEAWSDEIISNYGVKANDWLLTLGQLNCHHQLSSCLREAICHGNVQSMLPETQRQIISIQLYPHRQACICQENVHQLLSKLTAEGKKNHN